MLRSSCTFKSKELELRQGREEERERLESVLLNKQDLYPLGGWKVEGEGTKRSKKGGDARRFLPVRGWSCKGGPFIYPSSSFPTSSILSSCHPAETSPPQRASLKPKCGTRSKKQGEIEWSEVCCVCAVGWVVGGVEEENEIRCFCRVRCRCVRVCVCCMCV